MQLQDRMETEKADAKNSLEEYVYDMRDKLTYSLRDYIADGVRSIGFILLNLICQGWLIKVSSFGHDTYMLAFWILTCMRSQCAYCTPMLSSVLIRLPVLNICCLMYMEFFCLTNFSSINDYKF